LVTEIVRAAGVPVLAIGGVDLARMAAVAASGPQGAARSVSFSGDPGMEADLKPARHRWGLAEPFFDKELRSLPAPQFTSSGTH